MSCEGWAPEESFLWSPPLMLYVGPVRFLVAGLGWRSRHHTANPQAHTQDFRPGGGARD